MFEERQGEEGGKVVKHLAAHHHNYPPDLLLAVSRTQPK